MGRLYVLGTITLLFFVGEIASARQLAGSPIYRITHNADAVITRGLCHTFTVQLEVTTPAFSGRAAAITPVFTGVPAQAMTAGCGAPLPRFKLLPGQSMQLSALSGGYGETVLDFISNRATSEPHTISVTLPSLDLSISDELQLGICHALTLSLRSHQGLPFNTLLGSLALYTSTFGNPLSLHSDSNCQTTMASAIFIPPGEGTATVFIRRDFDDLGTLTFWHPTQVQTVDRAIVFDDLPFAQFNSEESETVYAEIKGLPFTFEAPADYVVASLSGFSGDDNFSELKLIRFDEKGNERASSTVDTGVNGVGGLAVSGQHLYLLYANDQIGDAFRLSKYDIQNPSNFTLVWNEAIAVDSGAAIFKGDANALTVSQDGTKIYVGTSRRGTSLTSLSKLDSDGNVLQSVNLTLRPHYQFAALFAEPFITGIVHDSSTNRVFTSVSVRHREQMSAPIQYSGYLMAFDANDLNIPYTGNDFGPNGQIYFGNPPDLGGGFTFHETLDSVIAGNSSIYFLRNTHSSGFADQTTIHQMSTDGTLEGTFTPEAETNLKHGVDLTYQNDTLRVTGSNDALETQLIKDQTSDYFFDSLTFAHVDRDFNLLWTQHVPGTPGARELFTKSVSTNTFSSSLFSGGLVFAEPGRVNSFCGKSRFEGGF